MMITNTLLVVGLQKMKHITNMLRLKIEVSLLVILIPTL